MNPLAAFLIIDNEPAHVASALATLGELHIANPIHVIADEGEASDILFGPRAPANRDAGELPALVLVGAHIPHANELVRHLHEDERTRSIPVVAMAASTEEQDKAKREGLGANSYVVEPMNQDRLCKAVKEVGFGWVIINPLLGMPRLASA